jgi:capsular polysaccharide biosynthesis protein
LDFFETMGVLFRRWYVVVPMLALTVFGAGYAFKAASASYEAKSTLVLVAPPASTGQLNPDGTKATPCTQNPYCASGNLLNLANVTTRAMADPSTTTRLLAGNPGTSYNVILDAEPSPIIEMTADGPTSPSTLRALHDVSLGVQRELERRQKGIGVPSTALITSSPVTTATSAEQQSAGKERALVIAAAVGLALTLLAAVLAEYFARSRRRRRGYNPKGDEHAEATGDRTLDPRLAGVGDTGRVPSSAESQEHLPTERSTRRAGRGPVSVRGRGSA